MGKQAIAIGSGSAYDNDRLDWPLELAESGLVDHMSFDCLADRSLSVAHGRRQADPSTGQDVRLGRIIDTFTPFLERGGTIVGNFGAANVDAAETEVLAEAEKAGLQGLAVGVIRGDEVLEQALRLDLELPELGGTVRDIEPVLTSANAYLGAEPIVEALEGGARFVLGGRIADPSLFVGPICHRLGWELDDWHRVGVATIAGHLLECGVHSTGGNFSDPPVNVTDNPAHLGFPFAIVGDDDVTIGKIDGTGGAVDERTTKTQLLYEVHDPSSYLTPDATVDFSEVSVSEIGPDRVRVTGMTARERPSMLKVLVGLDRGWKATGMLTFGGPGCLERAELAEAVLRERIAHHDGILEIRADYVGHNSLYGDAITGGYPVEVGLRVAVRCETPAQVGRVLYEVGYAHFGPAGGGAGLMSAVTPAIGVTPAYIPRSAVDVHVEVVTV